MSLSKGTRIGAYEGVAPVGAGGMGEVYRARDTRLDRTVALKVLPAEFFEDRDRVARFEREAKALAALNHHGQRFLVNSVVAEKASTPATLVQNWAPATDASHAR